MRRVVPLVLLLPVAMAGCGGGSTKSTTAKTDYVALADVICRNHLSRTQDLESQTAELGALDSSHDAHLVAGLLRQQAANLTAEGRELQGLQPPPADETKVKAMAGLVRSKARLITRWARAYDDLSTAKIRALQIRIGVATDRARNAARGDGFKVCGQG
jgi:hypothetical protein